MKSPLVEDFLGPEKAQLERPLSSESRWSAAVTLAESRKHDVRLPDIDHFLETFYGLDVETVIEGDYNEEEFTPHQRGSLAAYYHRAENILSDLDKLKPFQNHATFENADYSVPDDLARDMQFAEENLY